MSTSAPELPCKAKIISFERADGIGTLELEGGFHVRFGASSCVGFQPELGMDCWLIETKPNPVGGVRAKTVNLSGAKEADRLTQIEAANRRAEAWKQKERELLASVGIEDPRALPY